MVSTRGEGDGFVIELEGKVTTDRSRAFHEEIMKQVDDNAGKCLMDMTRVEYICSSGVGTVAQALKKLRDRGDDLFICGLNNNLDTLFRVTRLSRIIELFNNQDEGLARLRGQ